mgnify:CR=1 FL=1
MESNFLKLYSLAKYPYQESFLKSQLDTAGSNQARLLEKLEKNEGYMKQMNIVLKVVWPTYSLLPCKRPPLRCIPFRHYR